MKFLHLGLFLFVAMPAVAGAQTRPSPLKDTDFRAHTPAEIALGQLLFWDPELSGNRNISCGTCHNPRFGTGDGVSLSLGEGGIGLGPARRPDPANMPEQRIPRNAPALFNLGVLSLKNLFYDGRIETDTRRASGFRTPLEDEMVAGFASLVSAQAMFPVLASDEMAGHYSENEISQAVRQGRLTGPDGAWQRIAKRIAAIPEYQAMFDKAYPDIAAGRPLQFTDISNAIAAFVSAEWRSDSAPFDAWLRNEADLPAPAAAGAELFYGKAGCAVCHSGPLLTDQGFHAMGEPQLGPGKTERFETNQRDLGRMRVTNRAEDAYAFRTPSLRNVTATAPYGHAGAHNDLHSFIRFHSDPVAGLANYKPQAILPEFTPTADDWVISRDWSEIAAAVTRPATRLSDAEITAILAFLDSLTDPQALKGRLGIPDTVPSGLPIDRN